MIGVSATASGSLATVGVSFNLADKDPTGWYIAALWVAVITVMVWLWVFFWWPWVKGHSQQPARPDTVLPTATKVPLKGTLQVRSGVKEPKSKSGPTELLVKHIEEQVRKGTDLRLKSLKPAASVDRDELRDLKQATCKWSNDIWHLLNRYDPHLANSMWGVTREYGLERSAPDLSRIPPFFDAGLTDLAKIIAELRGASDPTE